MYVKYMTLFVLYQYLYVNQEKFLSLIFKVHSEMSRKSSTQINTFYIILSKWDRQN